MTYRLHVVHDVLNYVGRPHGYCSVHAERDGVTFRVGEVWREGRRWFGSLGFRQPAQTGPHRTRYAAFVAVTDLHEAKERKP
jgi:hypothetical protein